MRGTALVPCVLFAAMAMACGAEQRAAPVGSKGAAVTELNTYSNKYIEIDVLGGGPGDANLIADGNWTPAPVTPVPADQWIDWSDLDPSRHRLYDLDDPTAGADLTSFPRSNECVKDSQVLSKMDLTYVGVANNKEFAYFTVQRANNNGDAGYYWLLTKREPSLTLGGGKCKSDEHRLTYDIRKGDVLLQGHFQPSATPLLRVYVAQADVNGVGAVAAINYLDTSLWALNSAAIKAVAVNESNIAPGSWGAEGVKKQALAGGLLEKWLVAEAAVSTALFTGGSICGATFWGSVITRSSGSGGTTPDLKDLAGPKKFNFGNVTATASLTPSCAQQFGYAATLLDLDGQPVPTATCTWETLDSAGNPIGSPVLSGCSGVVAAPPGTYAARVTMTDPGSGCVAVATSNNVQVCAPLTVGASMTPTCLSTFSYLATPGGGCGDVSIGWQFGGACSPSITSSTSASGSVPVGAPGGLCTGTVTATDSRTDLPVGQCTATASTSATPFAPLGVGLAALAEPQVCSTNSDIATYTASASGGNGVYGYSWNTIGAIACNAGAGVTCTVDPSNDDLCVNGSLTVTVSDSSGLCEPVTSKVATYTKTTTVGAAVTP